MNNFDIIKICEDGEKVLIVMKMGGSPFDYVHELQQSLREISFKGDVLIDDLLHSGNSDERFIAAFF